MSNLDIARLILKKFNRDEPWLAFVADRPGHDRRYAIDASKIRRELGWKPLSTFAKAFDETLEWYIYNKKWIERVRKKTGVFNPHIDLWKAHRNTEQTRNPAKSLRSHGAGKNAEPKRNPVRGRGRL